MSEHHNKKNYEQEKTNSLDKKTSSVKDFMQTPESSEWLYGILAFGLNILLPLSSSPDFWRGFQDSEPEFCAFEGLSPLVKLGWAMDSTIQENRICPTL
jgi:hypothetical protein